MLRLIRKMFVEFRISFVFIMTMGTCQAFVHICATQLRGGNERKVGKKSVMHFGEQKKRKTVVIARALKLKTKCKGNKIQYWQENDPMKINWQIIGITIKLPITPSSMIVMQNTMDVVRMYAGICGISRSVALSGMCVGGTAAAVVADNEFSAWLKTARVNGMAESSIAAAAGK